MALRSLRNFISEMRITPIIFAFGLVLMTDIAVAGFMPIEETWGLASTAAIFTLILELIILCVVRNGNKTAVYTMVFVVWFSCFGPFCETMSSVLTFCHIPKPDDSSYLIPYSFIGIFWLWYCAKYVNADVYLRYLKWISGTSLIAGIVLGVTFAIPCETSAFAATEIMQGKIKGLNLTADKKPDIYYIILDAAGRADTLKDLYNMSDTSFPTFLKKSGFYVGTESNSNYDRTIFSLASFLNFNYLDGIESVLPKNRRADIVFYRLIQNNNAIRCLKKLGYTIVNISSGFPPTDYNYNATVNTGNPFGNHLSIALGISMSVFKGLEKENKCLSSCLLSKTLWIFSHIKEVEAIKGPKFVFIHILCPHPPFLLTADGGTLPLSPKFIAETYAEEKYRPQAYYIFRKAQSLIEQLLADNKDHLPIIIVQGDHGPQLNYQGWPFSQNNLKLRFGILNACYLPGVDHTALYSSISSVNTFRVIFNQYFGTHLDILPDVSYYATLDPPYIWYKWNHTEGKVPTKTAQQTRQLVK